MKQLLLAAMLIFPFGLCADEPKETKPEEEYDEITEAMFVKELEAMGVPKEAVPEKLRAKYLSTFIYAKGEFPRDELVKLIENRREVLASLTGGGLPLMLSSFKAEGASDARIVLTYRALLMAEEKIASQLEN